VDDCDRIYPIADEDLPRENDVKTSSVHFLRFELSPQMMAAIHAGVRLFAGIDHPAYTVDEMELPATVRDSLANDLEAVALN
jgi:hypothetical protein